MNVFEDVKLCLNQEFVNIIDPPDLFKAYYFCPTNQKLKSAMRQAIIFIALAGIATGVFSFKNSTSQKLAPNKTTSVNWLTWEQALEKSKHQKRKLLIDVYTDWCGWCKRMDAATFNQPQIAKYINENYYAVKFNAETKEDIAYNGKTYKFVKNGRRGYHELAAEITRGKLSYPTIVFIDENLEVIQPIPGFRDAMEFEKIITYFARNEHKRTPWESYQRAYKPLSVKD
jgi:thioredoxin-related protein